MDTQILPVNSKIKGPEILGIYHININTSDIEKSRAFYELLGFKILEEFGQAGDVDLDRGLGLPFTDTKAYFMGIGRNRHETIIDLVEWKEPRATGEALRLFDIGMPRIALRVTNLDEFYTHLSSQGVEFIAQPQKLKFLKNSECRFCCCKDPDGVVVELVELSRKSK